MIKSELILRIANQNPHLYDRDVELILRAILGRMADALAAGDRIEIRGLGTLALKDQRAREGRNPKTGQAVAVPERQSIVFKPSKVMKARLNPAALPDPAE